VSQPGTGGTILVVDDEDNIADLVELYLRKEGFRVLKAATGEDGLAAARRERPRLVVLDVGLPGIDGLEVCRRLRADPALGASGPGIPVIFLTARDGEIDRILGLEMGADDYLTKPFSPRELVARVKAILRRSAAAVPADEVIEVGGAAVDLARREVRAHLGDRGAPGELGDRGAPGEAVVIDLTGKEFELLRYLAENRGRALSRQQILDGVWGHGWYGDARTVDVHVAQVRKKLGGAVAITTVRGVGYRLDAP
jgi:DNA-binding response OmpR family regulator